MTSTTKAFWNLAVQQCELLPNDSGLKLFLEESLKDKYFTNCEVAYKNCKSNDMSDDVSNLDRHKVAAILVIEGLSLNIVKHEGELPSQDAGKLFIGPEKVLLSCAIHYLASQINKTISQNSFNNIQIMGLFSLPKAFSCENSYIDILCRLLHTSKKSDLSIFELSDRFFLLEYIAIHEYYRQNAEQVFDILRKSAIK